METEETLRDKIVRILQREPERIVMACPDCYAATALHPQRAFPTGYQFPRPWRWPTDFLCEACGAEWQIMVFEPVGGKPVGVVIRGYTAEVLAELREIPN